MGRKRLPDHLKLVTGTARPDRMNPNAPEPASDRPTPPSWLDDLAVRHFGVLVDRLEGLGLASSTDTEALALAAMRLSEIETCSALIAEQGRTVEIVRDGVVTSRRHNPAVIQRTEAARHLQSLLAEFGLTAASRSKVSVRKTKSDTGSPFTPRTS